MEFALHVPILINLLGHGAGTVAFGGLLLLLFRGARRRNAVKLPATAAGLAFGWNLGQLAALLSDADSQFRAGVAGLSMSVLSLLPATLLHLAIGPEHRWLIRAGYALGSAAALIHAANVAGLELAPTSAGMAAIYLGSSSLAIVSAVWLTRQGSGQRRTGMRTLTAMALFLLTVSFFHFGQEHPSEAWLHELLAHHAGLPLTLFVILQEYRFLLMDAFVRLVGTGLLAAGYAGTLLWAAESLDLLNPVGMTEVGLAAFLGIAAAVILSYPLILRFARAWSENFLFGRKDSAEATLQIRALNAETGDGLLKRAAETIADFASAERWKLLDSTSPVRVSKSEGAPAPVFESLPLEERNWVQAIVPMRDGVGSTRALLLGVREGSRRYLSVDLADLDRLVAEAAVRLDKMRVEEQRDLLRKAELATLRAQINPHFLFNAFNALNAIIPAGAADARRTLVNLADIFRYSLASKSQFVPLDEEMDIVGSYLQIERLRLGDRLSTRLEIDDGVRGQKVPALSIQPLVENAVKHGVSAKAEGGHVSVSAQREGDRLRIDVVDDGPGFDPLAKPKRGLGLRSVERRLQLCFGRDVDFRINSGRSGSHVAFSVPLRMSAA